VKEGVVAEEAVKSTGQYAAAAEALRATARWILGALAAIAAVLVGGLQLTGLGELGSDDLLRLAIAVGTLLCGMAAVGYMIHALAEVLTVEWVTLAHFDDTLFEQMLVESRGGLDRSELLEIGRKIEDVREELYAHVAASVGLLHHELHKANAEAALVGTDLEPEDPGGALARAQRLRMAAREVVDYANYERTRRLFSQIGRRLGAGAIVVVVCMSIFAYATNPPTRDTPLKVEITGFHTMSRWTDGAPASGATR